MSNIRPIPGGHKPIPVKPVNNTGPVIVKPIDHVVIDTMPAYDGDYHVIPGAEAIVLNTIDKRMEQDVIVDPIPSNYGLITWDGFKLVIS